MPALRYSPQHKDPVGLSAIFASTHHAIPHQNRVSEAGKYLAAQDILIHGIAEFRAGIERDTGYIRVGCGMQLASEKRVDAIDKRIEKLLQALERDGEHINALARIAESHEHRLSDLEGTHQLPASTST